MTRANTEQAKFVPWFAKAGAACSIVPIARFVNQHIFALKGGGYGCLFALSGIDEEGLNSKRGCVRWRVHCMDCRKGRPFISTRA
jgi:type IV secretion system protein VirB4